MPSDDSHKFIHHADAIPRPAFFRSWERVRHRQAHWLVECVAEATGVFLYCYCGASAAAAFTVGNLAELPFGSLFTVGLGYGMGVVLALVIAAGTSGGHLNPCFTIVHWLFRGFPGKKVPMYILAQIFGAYVAFGLLYVQYHDFIHELEAALTAKKAYDAVMFTPSGPAGIFALYANHGFNLRYVFLNEFMLSFMVALAVWACLDPTNMLTPPAAAPFIVAFAYAAAIWGFSPVGVALNTARDVGGRLFALTVWGSKASGGTYAAIAALTNIPATIFAVLFYEFFFVDSARVLNPATLTLLAAHKAHDERVASRHNDAASGHSGSTSGKVDVHEVENVSNRV